MDSLFAAAALFVLCLLAVFAEGLFSLLRGDSEERETTKSVILPCWVEEGFCADEREVDELLESRFRPPMGCALQPITCSYLYRMCMCMYSASK